jgi:hypothetical protein
MDIKAFDQGSFPAVSTKNVELQIQSSQRTYYPPSLSAADEIIDYVEIQSNNYQPAPNRPSSYPIRTDRSAKDKGTLIDLWI